MSKNLEREGSISSLINKGNLIKMISAIISIGSIMLPFWVLSFNAPIFGQKWLSITVYGYGMVEGPLDQINIANHYVGLSEINPNEMLELKLLPFLFIILTALIILNIFKKLSFKLMMYIYILSLVFMIVYFQFWLYKFGHQINSNAPIPIEPFTPYVMGSYSVANFSAVAYFHAGFWLLMLVLVLVFYGEKMVSRKR